MRERFSRWICRHLHRGITRPVNGAYICLRCQRRVKIDWNVSSSTAGVSTMPRYGCAGGPRIVRERSA
jgi:hypothetical protein